MRKKGNSTRMLVGVVGLVGVIGLGVASTAYVAYGTQDSIVATVTGKDRVVSKEDSKWIVMTDMMSFENIDSIMHMKFNSTDIQGKLVEGQTYLIDYYGFRVPFLNMYPNIIEVSPAPESYLVVE